MKVVRRINNLSEIEDERVLKQLKKIPLCQMET